MNNGLFDDLDFGDFSAPSASSSRKVPICLVWRGLETMIFEWISETVFLSLATLAFSLSGKGKKKATMPLPL